MYNRQSSRTAPPFGHNHLCEVQFQLLDQIIISNGLWDMRHRGKMTRFGLLG
jgi:hypothetical protein